MSEQSLMTTKEAAKRLGLSPATLALWRCLGNGPGLPFVKLGRRSVRYRPSDIEALIERLVVES